MFIVLYKSKQLKKWTVLPYVYETPLEAYAVKQALIVTGDYEAVRTVEIADE